MSKTSIRRSYASHTPKSPDAIDQLRNEARDRTPNKLLAIGLVAIALAGGAEAYNKLTAPHTRTVTETVNYGDNPYTLAERAENQYGQDKGEYDPQAEAIRLAARYGTLQAGERIKVHVK